MELRQKLVKSNLVFPKALIHVNDLSNSSGTDDFVLFADDTNLLVTVKSITEAFLFKSLCKT